MTTLAFSLYTELGSTLTRFTEQGSYEQEIIALNFSCRPPGMTEESRHIQLTNQINFVPALCGLSNMNAFTIFIPNSSLADNHSTKYKRYVDMDD